MLDIVFFVVFLVLITGLLVERYTAKHQAQVKVEQESATQRPVAVIDASLRLPVQYPDRFHFWYTAGQLTLENGQLTLSGKKDVTKFQYPLNAITAFRYDGNAKITIEANSDKKVLLVGASAAAIKGLVSGGQGLTGMEVQNKAYEQARQLLEPWLIFFKQRGVPISD